MSDHKKEAKAASAAKMQRMGLKLDDGSKSFDDMRGGSPFEGLNSGNAGKWPVTPSRFKRGGKVGKHAEVEGHKAHKNLGKTPRKAVGGSTDNNGDYTPKFNYISSQGGNTEASRYGSARYKAEQDADYATQKMEDYANPFDIDTDSKDAMAARYTAEKSLAKRKAAAQQQGYDNYARGGLSSMSPAKRKAAIGAMVARKKMAGLPSVAPASRGVMPSAPMSGLVPMRKHGGATKHPDEAEDKKLVKKMVKPSALKDRAEKCWGGEAESKSRPHRATGGRTKAGKTNVNIIISPQSGQNQPLGAGVGMGQPPVPPMMPPMGGMPPGMPPMPPAGGAPQLPPQLMAAMAARGGAGAPPMPRKTGGRVGGGMPKYQEKDYGSGSGLGRLEKKKWPVADGTE
jgi:hypothetical protein